MIQTTHFYQSQMEATEEGTQSNHDYLQLLQTHVDAILSRDTK